MAKIQVIDGKVKLDLRAMPKLTFTEDKSTGLIKYGKDNLYPQELIKIYSEHPEHKAIIDRKSRYIWGKGLKAVNPEDEIKVNAFIDTFNRKETLNQVGKKLSKNTELFNGCYIEIITNLAGVPTEMYFLNSANCRISEDGETLGYCKNITKNVRDSDYKKLCKYEDGQTMVGSFFTEFKYYTPSSNKLASVYPTPQYQSIVGDICTDIGISIFNSEYVDSGFSVATIINFFKGVPTDEQIGQIKNGIEGTYGGEKGKQTLIIHNDPMDKEPTVTKLDINDLSEKFAFTSKRAQKKIFSGHEMASELFNIKFEDSFLSGSTDLLTLQELFIKGYIEPRQTDLLEFLSYLSFIKTGEYLEMMFEPLGLIGIDIQNNPVFTDDEKRIALGAAPLKIVQKGVDGLPIPIEATEVNDALVGLSATKRNDINRIVHQFKTKKNGTSEALAIASLGAYGFSVSDSKKFLGINEGVQSKLDAQMSSQVDKVLLALQKCAKPDNDDIVLKIEAAHIHNSKDALKYERQILRFADALIITVEQLDSAVLTALKGNPLVSIDEIAKITQSDSYKIEESIGRLVKKGFLTDEIGGFKPTEKAIEKQTEPIVSDEVYTVYKYALKEDAPALVKGGSSRTFCKEMMLTSKSNSWTFEELDGLENDLGTNVWDYRGGYYTNPNTNEVDPDCRHIWHAITKTRKVKK